MAWYVLVGHIPQNKSGVGARGYQLYRSGTKVHCEWGKIEVTGGMTSRFRWAHGRRGRKTHPCRTVSNAVEKRLSLERGLLSQYSRLPPGSRILPATKR